MPDGLKKGLVIAFLATGVWLFAMKELRMVPMGTLLLYAAVWVAVGIGGLLLLFRRPALAKPPAGPNPFEQMLDEEREKARAILGARFQGREVPTEDNNWLAMLLERYAPLLTQAQQMDRFTDYLSSRPVMAPADAARASVELPRADPDEDAEPGEELHGGPAIVLARALRRPGFDVTRDGSSWFGGLPALGEQSWPRDDLGQPMTPLAQIDLTGLAAHLQVPGLPNQGSLAFFASFPKAGEGAFGGTVRYVPGPARHPTQPDGPLPKVENNTFGGPLRRGEPEADQRLYPRMAMDLVRVRASGLTDRAGFAAEVTAALGPWRAVNLDGRLLPGGETGNRPWNRDSLLRFLHGARVSLNSAPKAEVELRRIQAIYANSVQAMIDTLAKPEVPDREVRQARLETTQRALKQLDATLADIPAATGRLVEELETMEMWARAGDRWTPLTEAEQQVLAPLLNDWTDYNGLGRAHLNETYEVHRRIDDCVTETLLVMAVAEDAVFERLPEALREEVNGPYRQPSRGVFHKMFGEPSSIQDAAFANQGSYLLLQLHCDDLAGFHWGDMGVLQFWITPSALQAGRWEEAYLTFEGN
ncbi:MAG: DUF1963 domain-containing protein [Rhodobacterales bacterium]|nr:MAG: DUF1963 domain-containing protein [Rhodobacterales bacterium]